MLLNATEVIDYGFYKNKEDFDLERFINEQGYRHWTEYSPEEKNARDLIYNKYKNEKGYLPLYDSDEYKKMQEELNEYPGIEKANMCIRECFIRKDKLDIYHKVFSEVKEKYSQYEWIR